MDYPYISNCFFYKFFVIHLPDEVLLSTIEFIMKICPLPNSGTLAFFKRESVFFCADLVELARHRDAYPENFFKLQSNLEKFTQ